MDCDVGDQSKGKDMTNLTMTPKDISARIVELIKNTLGSVLPDGALIAMVEEEVAKFFKHQISEPVFQPVNVTVHNPVARSINDTVDAYMLMESMTPFQILVRKELVDIVGPVIKELLAEESLRLKERIKHEMSKLLNSKEEGTSFTPAVMDILAAEQKLRVANAYETISARISVAESLIYNR